MKSFHFLMLIFWVNGQHLTKAEEEDSRYFEYRKCLSKTESVLFGKRNTEYDRFNHRHNNAYPKGFPIAVFTPKSTSDVQTAVKCGVKTNLQLVPISGGHSYAGLSDGTNDSILIDFRHMNRISLDRSKMVVTVEPGAMIGRLYYRLLKDDVMVPLGVCLTVATGGFILGGGVGSFSNHFGLAIDNLVEINMVDAKGNAIVADRHHNEDLWWAMRGIGPGYIGLLTSVKMRVFNVTDLDIVHVQARFRNDNFKNVMEAYIKWLDWVVEKDPKISSVMTIHRDDQAEPESIELDRRGIVLDIIKVRGSQMKNLKPNLSFINVALDMFAAKLEYHSFELHRPTFVELLALISYGSKDMYLERLDIDNRSQFYSTLTRENASLHVPNHEAVRSFFIKKSHTPNLTAKNLDEAQKLLLEMPDDGTMNIDYEQGKISEFKPNSTAYVHRDAFINIKMHVSADSMESLAMRKEWLNKFYESIQFLDSGETYQNYPERSMGDYLQRFYGSNLERLVAIKRRWDPKYYFNSEMSLPIDLQ